MLGADPLETAVAAVGARLYFLEILGTIVFAMTGVLVVARRGLDIFGALVLGLVTALGGGTLRDAMMRVPIFWIVDFNYVWFGLTGALIAFWAGALLRSTQRVLLYLDGLGAALFAVTAANKALLLQFSPATAVVMGVLTGIGGGLLRDVLAGRPTLLMSREIYATPILLGCTLFVMLGPGAAPFSPRHAIAVLFIFGLRAAAIRWHLEMPAWLTQRSEA